MSLESKLLRPDRLSVIAKMFSWHVGSKDEGAAPEIDSQIDPDITRYHPGYHPRISAQPMIPVSARSASQRLLAEQALFPQLGMPSNRSHLPLPSTSQQLAPSSAICATAPAHHDTMPQLH